MVLADVTVLTAGIEGAVVLSILSSALGTTGFLVERSLPATGIIFTDPEIPIPRKRQESSSKIPENTQEFCPRPKLPIGQTLNDVHQKFTPILNKIPEQITSIQSKISMMKTKLLDMLGLQCLFPILFHPFDPILTYFRCLLGLNYNDGFMSVPTCSSTICSQQEVEEQEIDHRLEIPPMETTDLAVRTMDSCFRSMKRVNYGTRVLVKLVDDKSCDDPKFEKECEELIAQDRVVMEDTCNTPG